MGFTVATAVALGIDRLVLLRLEDLTGHQQMLGELLTN